jgi:hypothetical protein
LGASRPALLQALLDLYAEHPRVIARRLEDFVAENSAGVAATLDRISYQNDPARLLTPETLLVLERLAHDRSRLAARWPSSIPRSELYKLAAQTGAPFDE